MAFTGNWTDSAAIVFKAGNNASIPSEDNMNELNRQAESFINYRSKHDWNDASSSYASLSTHFRGALSLAASAWVAIRIIRHDMKPIGLEHATTRIDVLTDEFNAAMKELEDKDKQDFMEAA